MRLSSPCENKANKMALWKTFKYISCPIGSKCFNKYASSLSHQYDTVTKLNVDDSAIQNDFTKETEDLSSLTPYYPKAFNLAAYANSSEVIQNFLHLQVNLSKIEKKPHIAAKILRLDNDSLKDFILFIKDYVHEDEIGAFITKNPMLIFEAHADLKVRINYLQSKRFSHTQIQRIISNNPFWLMFSTIRIDSRLGYFQEKFHLCGEDLRKLTVKQPKLITYNLHHITTNTFVIKEEMGFEDKEMEKLILDKPKLWMISQQSLLERFKYIHNIMNIPHSAILHYPGILLCRNFRVKQRHLFLQKLGRDQFDPKRENYVPVKALVEGTDVEFCKMYAKCNVNDFNMFLKTL